MGSVKPTKLDKKKYKPVRVVHGRRAPGGHVTGTQANPRSEFIPYGKNIKFDLNEASALPVVPPIGSTPASGEGAVSAGLRASAAAMPRSSSANGATLIADRS